MSTEIDYTDAGAETRAHKAWLGEDGIIHVEAKPRLTQVLQDGINMTEVYKTLSQGKLRPVVVNMTNIKGIDRDCRVYYAGKEHCDTFLAVALIVGTPVTRVIGNFFLGIQKPLKPTRVFTTKEKAVEWVQTFID